MKYEQLAKDILELIGGEENVNSLAHCVTRLRFKLKDQDKAKTEEIQAMKGVLNVVKAGGLYQVVIGSHVSQVYKAVLSVSNIIAGGQVTADEDSQEKGSLFDRFVDTVSGIFGPILIGLMAAGLLQGVSAILDQFNVAQGTSVIFGAMGNAFFRYLPLVIGYSAMKKFGGTPLLGLMMGAILVHPDVTALAPVLNDTRTPLTILFEGSILETPIFGRFLGIPIILPINGYAQTVMPMIFIAFVAAKVEKAWTKIIPDMVKLFLVPFLTVIIVMPVAFLFIGPVVSWISLLIGEGAVTMFNFNAILFGAIIGGTWMILVMFGLHWGLVPIALMIMFERGYGPLLVGTIGHWLAITGATGAVYLKTKDGDLKQVCIPAMISGVFGVTEPAIYGVTLPKRKPFIAACLASAIAGGGSWSLWYLIL